LAYLYQKKPKTNLPKDKLKEAIADWKRTAERHQQYAKIKSLDPNIVAMYGDLISTIDAYSSLLIKLGRVDGYDPVPTSQQSAGGKIINAVKAGNAIKEKVHLLIKSATAAGHPIALAGFVLDELTKSARNKSKATQALRAATHIYQMHLDKVQSKADLIALTLEEKYGWKRGEAGFYYSKASRETVKRLTSTGNISGLAQMARDQIKIRSRDPFLYLGYYQLHYRDIGSKATGETLKGYINGGLNVAKLIPKGRFYDSYRALALLHSGYFANKLVDAELKDGAWVNGPTKSSQVLVKVWRTYLQYDPLDATGEGRQHLAWALAANGQHQDALKKYQEVATLRNRSKTFAYNMACIHSITGSNDKALAWLKQAIVQLGYSNLARAKRDPDLAKLRKTMPTEFSALTEIKFNWNIRTRLGRDDVLLKNYSTFTLTNVTFKLNIVNANQSISIILKVKKIPPGQTYTWSTALFVPKNKFDRAKSTATLSCNQNK